MPDFLMVSHLEHAEPIVVTVVGMAAGVGKWVLDQSNEETYHLVTFGKHGDAFRQS